MPNSVAGLFTLISALRASPVTASRTVIAAVYWAAEPSACRSMVKSSMVSMRFVSPMGFDCPGTP